MQSPGRGDSARQSSRRSRVIGAAAAVGVVASVALGIYARFVAPYRIETTIHTVVARVSTPLRLLQISDLHTREFGRREKQVLQIVSSARPDVIVITGDNVTDGVACDVAKQTLDQLSAPMGVFMVAGNWEYWMAERYGASCLCPSKRVRCLSNQAVRLQENLWLVGLDDVLTGSDHLEAALADVPSGADIVLLAHEPVAIDKLRRGGLVLAGHTHGGQLCLPLVGPLALPPGSGSYVSGWYRQGSKRMYVSRGIGNSIVDARLVCGPEIPIFDLVSAVRPASTRAN